MPVRAPRRDPDRGGPEPLDALLLSAWRPQNPIGSGGLGSIHRGRHPVTGESVAIKILRGHWSRDPMAIERFFAEAKVLSRVRHPNIPRLYGSGRDEAEGLAYVVLEFVEGDSLDHLIRENGGLPAPRAVEIVCEVARALRALHRGGFVHRDVKPANILVGARGRVKLLDFGLIGRTGRGERTGRIVGTPLFMPAEALESGASLNPRRDIYSLGVTLYHALSGEYPIQGGAPTQHFSALLSGDTVPLRERLPALPRRLLELVNRMTAHRPEDRYPDCDALIRDLERLVREDLRHP